MQKLKEQCNQVLSFTEDVKLQICAYKEELNEKTHQILKLQSAIQMIETDAGDLQSVLWRIQKQTNTLKEMVENPNENNDSTKTSISEQFLKLQEEQSMLEEMIFSYLLSNKLQVRKYTKRQSDQNKENVEGNKHEVQNQKLIQKHSTIKKKKNDVSNFINNDVSFDDDEQQQQKRKRLRKKEINEKLEQSNNLINDLLNLQL